MVAELHHLLATVTEDLAKRSVDAWKPAYGSSQARNEADSTAKLTRSDGVTLWGDAPMTVVWKASELLYVAALEFVRATAALMVPPFRAWAPSVEVRSAIEAAGQLLWLTDPKLPSGRTRVGRYYTLRLHAARQLEYTFNTVNSGGAISDYGLPPADVEAQAMSLGVTPVVNKKNQVIGYERQQMPRIEELVRLVVGDNGAYSVLSGAAHSEFWSLLGGYQGAAPSPLGITVDDHEADLESFIAIVRASAQALFKPIDYAGEIFGRSALQADLERLYTTVVATIGK